MLAHDTLVSLLSLRQWAQCIAVACLITLQRVGEILDQRINLSSPISDVSIRI